MAADTDLIRRIRAATAPLTPRPTPVQPSIEAIDGIRAVLFDVYGTLVISGCGDIGLTRTRGGTPHSESDGDPLRHALATAGIDGERLRPDLDGRAALIATIEAHHAERRAQGVAFPEVDILAVWRDLLRAHGIDADDARIRRAALEYELAVNPVWPMPGMRELIRGLAARGLVLGIVSNAQFYTPLMLEAFFGCSLERAGFDTRCCGWSYRLLEGKPSTRVYREALAALESHHGIAAGETLYVGNDMRNDIWPARAAGCKTALFAGDARSLRWREGDPDVGDIAPDRTVTALQQIGQALLPGPAAETTEQH